VFAVDAIDAAFNRNRGSSKHAWDCEMESFTKLELERMEQVKASFSIDLKIVIPHDEENEQVGQWLRRPLSDYETRIECWKPQRNNVG